MVAVAKGAMKNMLASRATLGAALAASILVLVGCRELAEPKDGYIIVPHILSPVTIRTKGLEGEGWLKAYTNANEWEVIHVSPAGAFTYKQVLPTRVWHCNKPDGSEGCVALLQAGDEKGYLNASKREQGKFHVCTESYLQRMGRKHCGERALEKLVFPNATDPVDRVALSRTQTDGVLSHEYPTPGATYAWKGDSWSRLVSGSISSPDLDRWHPPAENGPTSTWRERQYVPGGRALVTSESENVSIDIGACSIFFPWQWEDRMPNDFWSLFIGLQTEQRGFAEVMLDGIIEHAEPSTNLMLDAFLYMDALTNVVQRTDVSPEFHVSAGSGARGSQGDNEIHICLRNYFTASNDIRERPDAWYRWDQAILSGFTSLFGIGDCKARPVSVFYCGAIDLDSDGRGRFRIDPDVRVAMEGYSVFKPSCNNKFIPAFKESLKKGIRTAGEQNLSDAIDQLVRGLRDSLGVEARALEPSPTGLYIVTAQTLDDPQYGIGNCLPDLEAQDVVPVLQPSLIKEYTARGITRF
ncbi:MAG: hypothetical protein AMJ62_07245 [Myxococcales bacterium SG8_38]|nr:MAG: hypothetical protein AMJ62_07245 [Myxococcales bacterium SG8_38]